MTNAGGTASLQHDRSDWRMVIEGNTMSVCFITYCSNPEVHQLCVMPNVDPACAAVLPAACRHSKFHMATLKPLLRNRDIAFG